MQTSQILQLTSLILLSIFKYFQSSLELSKVLLNTIKVYSGCFKSICSNEDVFKILQYLTYIIVKFWSI